jgi:hypothetical protein
LLVLLLMVVRCINIVRIGVEGPPELTARNKAIQLIIDWIRKLPVPWFVDGELLG